MAGWQTLPAQCIFLFFFQMTIFDFLCFFEIEAYFYETSNFCLTSHGSCFSFCLTFSDILKGTSAEKQFYLQSVLNGSL